MGVSGLLLLGRIAAATAHEINNPLAYVIANLDYVSKALKPGDDPELHSALVDASEGARRIQRIVGNMNSLASGETEKKVGLQVADALKIAITIAEPHTTLRAKVRTQFAEAPDVLANEARLTQVFLSLLLNAARAVPEGRSHEHEISIDLRAQGTQVVVAISDTGARLETRGLGEGESLAVILGEAVVHSFGGTLSLETAGSRTVARLSLPSEFRDGTPGAS